MDALLLMLVSFLGYVIAYHSYGRFLARKIFSLDKLARTPAHAMQDGTDYVPTKKVIVFGHHFTSIAGTGPIVGPAIGIIWGWVPAMLWIFLGSIFMGAVHDFSALVISLRNQGKSVAEITAKYINPRVRFLFFLIVFFALLIVIAIFGVVIAIVFKLFPGSVFPVWCQIPIALLLSAAVYKKHQSVALATFVAVIAMYATVFIGSCLPITMPSVTTIPATVLWTILLLGYVFFASVLPVTALLQPRDYINAWQLFIAMGLIVGGVFAAAFFADLKIVAPAFNLSPEGAPPIWPFLFITIACGAISGFHCLVSSGTTSKQVDNEADAQMLGYGSMLLEATLSTLVIVAVAAGIGMAYTFKDGTVLTGMEAWQAHYISWNASAGLASKINAVVVGMANMVAVMGIPKALGSVIMGVFIASFAGTTLDTATRIQRYIITEIFSGLKTGPARDLLTNKWAATLIAIVSAAFLAFSAGVDGKGALTLWPLFGAVNQLLAALGLLVATFYLKTKGGLKFLFTAVPAMIMFSLTFWAMICNEIQFMNAANLPLLVMNTIILFLAAWVALEAVISLPS